MRPPRTVNRGYWVAVMAALLLITAGCAELRPPRSGQAAADPPLAREPQAGGGGGGGM